MSDIRNLFACWNSVDSIAIVAGFCSGLFHSGIDFFLRIKFERQIVPADRIAIAILLSSLSGAVLFYIGIAVVFRILDPSVSATELNRFSFYLVAVSIITPFVERISLAILTRVGIFNRQQ